MFMLQSGAGVRAGGAIGSDRFGGWARDGSARDELFESLERRLVLTLIGPALPELVDMETQTNPVVAFETEFGNIFLELFPEDAPTTVENFLRYVESGRYTDSFIHRNPTDQFNEPGNFVLQGGNFYFDNEEGLDQIENFDPIANEFARPNVERTLAMALAGGNPDSATSSWFINLVDNTSTLDPQDFTVFGRVLDDASWGVVQTISSLNVQNLAQQFQRGDLEAIPMATPFDPQQGLREENLVFLLNAQTVKPEGSQDFYQHLVIHPEGFRSPTSGQQVDLVNTNDAEAYYQIIIRYEEGMRDEVIASGTLPANTTATLTLHDFNTPQQSLVRGFTPYAIEVYSSVDNNGNNDQGDPVPVYAALRHIDFGGALGDAFWDYGSFGGADRWDFSLVDADAISRGFIVWHNPSPETTEVTVEFYIPGSGTPVTETFTTEGYRRGGVFVQSVDGLSDLPANVLIGARVFSSETDIVAAVSNYSMPDEGELPQAMGSIGLAGGGDTLGLLPGLIRTEGGLVQGLRVGGSAVVTLQRYFNDGDQRTTNMVIQGNRTESRLFDTVLAQADQGESASIRYQSQVGIAVQAAGMGDRTETTSAYMASAISNVGTSAHIAGGLLAFDDNGVSTGEAISVFNPYDNQAIDVVLEFRFSDGTVIETSRATLDAKSRGEFRAEDLSDVLSKVQSGEEFQNYSVTVRGYAEGGSDARHVAASMIRDDRRDVGQFAQSMALNAIPSGDVRHIGDSIFSGTPG